MSAAAEKGSLGKVAEYDDPIMCHITDKNGEFPAIKWRLREVVKN